METKYEVKQGSGEWEVRDFFSGKIHSAWKKLDEARKVVHDLNRKTSMFVIRRK